MRFLTNDDVDRLVSPADALATVRAAFEEVAAGTAAMQPRERTAVGGVKLSTLGAVLCGDGVLGAKVYSTVGGRFTFLVVLFAADDGRRLAVLESDAVTRLRTGATSVVAAQHLARPEIRRVAVFGAGVQALGHVAAFRDAFAPDEITLVVRSPRPPRPPDPQLEAADVLVTTDAAAAIDAADVVVTATKASEPLFSSELLPDGVHVSAVGATGPDVRELDEGAYAMAATVAVEWGEQAREEAGGLIHAVAAGALGWDEVVDLANVVSGRVPVARGPGDVTIFQSVGVGVEDIAVAGLAWRRAEADGVGVVLGNRGDPVVASGSAGRPLGPVGGRP